MPKHLETRQATTNQSNSGPAYCSQMTLPSTFSILSGLSGASVQTNGIISKLEAYGFYLDDAACLKLVLDTPQGFALRKLEALDRSNLRLVIVTLSLCPEYWEDLWSLQPYVLLVGSRHDHELVDAIIRVHKGERYRATPNQASMLNATERQVLRYLAHGYPNKQIADRLNMQEKTIRNSLTIIFKKLRLNDRQEAALYYWGIWQVLNDTYSSNRV